MTGNREADKAAIKKQHSMVEGPYFSGRQQRTHPSIHPLPITRSTTICGDMAPMHDVSKAKAADEHGRLDAIDTGCGGFHYIIELCRLIGPFFCLIFTHDLVSSTNRSSQGQSDYFHAPGDPSQNLLE